MPLFSMMYERKEMVIAIMDMLMEVMARRSNQVNGGRKNKQQITINFIKR